MMRAAVDAAAERAARTRHSRTPRLRGHAADQHCARGSQRARAARRPRRKRDPAGRAWRAMPAVPASSAARTKSRDLKRFFGDDFLTLTPGIRPTGSAHGDQKRVTTPAEAVAAGSDYIVVGRPIVEACRSGRRRQSDFGGDERTRVSDRSSTCSRRWRNAERLLEGHFRLSSGRHSDRFVQKFRILEDPALLEPVSKMIAARFRDADPTVVVGAAVGGILLAYEVARQLGTKAIFVEKENGVPLLRRGFALSPADRALVVEDVVTTGLSVREVFGVVRHTARHVVGVGIIVAARSSLRLVRRSAARAAGSADHLVRCGGMPAVPRRRSRSPIRARAARERAGSAQGACGSRRRADRDFVRSLGRRTVMSSVGSVSPATERAGLRAPSTACARSSQSNRTSRFIAR